MTSQLTYNFLYGAQVLPEILYKIVEIATPCIQNRQELQIS